MATCTVLFRFQLGLPYRQASKREKDACGKAWKAMMKRWKSKGVKMKASFNCSSHPDGYSHHWILEVESLERVQELDADVVGGALGRYLEKFAFEVGSSSWDEHWTSA